MGKIGLQIKANLENVTDLAPEGADFRWYLKLKCMNCGEETERWQYLTELEKVSVKGSRGEANLVSKCKLCGRENSMDIIKNSVSKYTKEDSDSNSFKTLVAFDCRGVEPTDFSPRTGFTAKSTDSNATFSEINLEEKEWVDYDEKSQQSVGIYELTHQFVKL